MIDFSILGYDSIIMTKEKMIRGLERRKFLESNPFCAKCYEEGHITMATVVDHIKPHRGDQKLFWDRGNWQALCKRCHDRKTLTEDINPVYRY